MRCSSAWSRVARERLTQEMFHRQGYTVMETRRDPDGGVDLTLRKEGQLTLVQCK